MNRNLLSTLALALVSALAHGQTPATVTLSASHITLGAGGALVPDGSQLCAITTDANDAPAGYRIGAAGGQTSASSTAAYQDCHPITGGALSTPLTLINSAASSPLNACIRLTLKAPNGQEIRRDKCVQTGTAFALSSGFCHVDGSVETCDYDAYPRGSLPVALVQVVAGATGATGPVFGNYVGQYVSIQTYAQKDVVAYNGLLYLSLVNSNTGNTPSSSPTQWAQVAVQPPSNPASAANPLYLYAHFRDDDEALYLSYSRDGATFAPVNVLGSLHSYMRDPSVIYDAGTKTFYFVSSGMDTGGTGPFPSTTFQFFSSQDLQTFSSIQAISPHVASVTSTWAPEFFSDPVSGNTYVIVATSTDGVNTMGPTLQQFYPATGTFASASTHLTLNGTDVGRSLDFTIQYIGGLYYLFFSDANNSAQAHIKYATSTSLTGPYTTATSGDVFGFGSFAEAPSVVQLKNGCYRIYADEWTVLNSTTGMRKYDPFWVDSCSGTPFASISGLPQRVTIADAEHGTVLKLTDPNAASAVAAAAATNPANTVGSRFGVNTKDPKYAVEIKSRSTTHNGITYDEAAALGLNPGDGNDFVLMGCSGDSTMATCPLIPASGGKGITYTTSDAFGARQIWTGHCQETSILFGNNPSQWGTHPISGDPTNRSIWAFGQNLGGCNSGTIMNVDGSYANNHFAFYNLFLNKAFLSISPDDGAVTIPFESGIAGGLRIGQRNTANPKQLIVSTDPTGNTVSIAGIQQNVPGNPQTIRLQPDGGNLTANGRSVVTYTSSASGTCTSSGQVITLQDEAGHTIKVQGCL